MSQRYSFGWSDPRALYKFGFEDVGVFDMEKKFETEAGKAPLSDLYNMWLIKFGNEPVTNVDIQALDLFMFECGQRLYNAHMLAYPESSFAYRLKTKEEIDADRRKQSADI